MLRYVALILGLLALLVGLGSVNLEAEEKPIRALLVTGGLQRLRFVRFRF